MYNIVERLLRIFLFNLIQLSKTNFRYETSLNNSYEDANTLPDVHLRIFISVINNKC